MIYLLSIVVGLIVGSFANVCIVCLPNDESLYLPASHFTHFQKPLFYVDNIPLVSYLILKGKCRFCHAPISWQYPLVEFAMACLFLISAWRFSGNGILILVCDLLSFYLLTISIIDFYHKIIPDELSLSL